MMVQFLSQPVAADAACDEMLLSTLNLLSEFQTEYRTKMFSSLSRFYIYTEKHRFVAGVVVV